MEHGGMAPAGEAQMLADLQRQLADLMQQPIPGASRTGSRTSSRQAAGPVAGALQAEPAQPAPQAAAVAALPLLLQGGESQPGSPRIRAVYARMDSNPGLTPPADVAAAAAAPKMDGSRLVATAVPNCGEEKRQVCLSREVL